MSNNLMPPFVLLEEGIKLNDTPNIQVYEPTIEDHSLIFPDTRFRIPLLLWGIFSYFPTCKPTSTNMQNYNDIYILTTYQFNPHDELYAANEDTMLYWESNMVEQKHTTKILLSEVEDNEAMAASVQVSGIDTRATNSALETSDYKGDTVKPCYRTVLCAADEISSILGAVSPLLDNMDLYEHLSEGSYADWLYIRPRQGLPHRGG